MGSAYNTDSPLKRYLQADKNEVSVCSEKLYARKSYVSDQWRTGIKQNPKAKKLPAVLPMVFYHGRWKWKIPDNFKDTVEDDFGIMKPYIPDFCHEIYDISHLSDEEIRGEVLTRIVLLTAKYIFRPDMKEKVFETARLFQTVANQQTALEILEVLLRYVTQATGKFDEDDVRNIIKQTSMREDIMQTFIDKYISQGRQQGLQQMAKIFLRQMEIRFGGIPQWAEEKIRKDSGDSPYEIYEANLAGTSALISVSLSFPKTMRETERHSKPDRNCSSIQVILNCATPYPPCRY